MINGNWQCTLRTLNTQYCMPPLSFRQLRKVYLVHASRPQVQVREGVGMPLPIQARTNADVRKQDFFIP